MPHLRDLAGIFATAALLTGCGGSELSSPSLATSAVSSGSQTFNYKGRKQVFHVPAGVKRVAIAADGASGSTNYGSGSGGGGSYSVLMSVPNQCLMDTMGIAAGYYTGSQNVRSGRFQGFRFNGVRGDVPANAVTVWSTQRV
jgi:hypothetical protein